MPGIMRRIAPPRVWRDAGAFGLPHWSYIRDLEHFNVAVSADRWPSTPIIVRTPLTDTPGA
jgi:hypothetical protein